MDPLDRDDIERARRMSPEEKATLLMAMIRAGYALKRAGLRARYPSASQTELDERFQRWLERADEP